MYSHCLNVIFRASVDVRGVVKNGQVGVVSNICQNSLCIWRIHCVSIVYPLKRQMEHFRKSTEYTHFTVINLPLLSI